MWAEEGAEAAERHRRRGGGSSSATPGHALNMQTLPPTGRQRGSHSQKRHRSPGGLVLEPHSRHCMDDDVFLSVCLGGKGRIKGGQGAGWA
jgi:hypothetical protein